ncbi:PREDICTED: uncharacterized protein LOC101303106 [Fragaria vesca subsp. vesca]|uniref:uncharacterized protein LOC101303106 n=1 Tax=Fragaria vesca subsp. vesca TaxID=101020 RepID=UPI0002C35077|nr:PREDICTED: uncharacterized protein LOC101303106 [Fragaria vesca subsp. vesca]
MNGSRSLQFLLFLTIPLFFASVSAKDGSNKAGGSSVALKVLIVCWAWRRWLVSVCFCSGYGRGRRERSSTPGFSSSLKTTMSSRLSLGLGTDLIHSLESVRDPWIVIDKLSRSSIFYSRKADPIPTVNRR